MAKKSKPSAGASDILYRRYYDGKSPQRLAEARTAMAALALGDKIRLLREQVGMTQSDLAKRIGTQPSQISRIEDADYESHSVETLRRIAIALNATLSIELIPGDSKKNRLLRAG
jgi:ribosome-binding protein aMBF1 (putative translation factor)